MSFAKIKERFAPTIFVKGAIILSLGAIICKLIGAIYRIPLTNILGEQGIGLYQMVYPIFTLLLVIASSGVPNAISRLIAEKTALGQKNYIRKIIHTSVWLMLAIGLVFSLVLFVFADELGEMQGNPMVSSAYKVISPSVVIVTMISVFRGVFQGMGNMTPTAISQIIEQLVKLVFGLLFAYLLRGEGSGAMVVGALFGITLSELFSLIYITLSYINKRRTFAIRPLDSFTPKTGDVVREILRLVCPVTLASSFMPIILVVDSVMLVNLLQASGQSVAKATASYGLYSGVANTIINMPIVVATAIATAIVPVVCTLLAKKDFVTASKKINLALDSVLAISIPAFLGFLFFGGEIARFLFPVVASGDNENVVNMLMQMGSINVILISIVGLSSACLHCLNRLYAPAFGMFVGCLAKIFISIVLVWHFGIVAGMIASVICYLLVACVNLRFLGSEVNISLTNAPVYMLASVVFVAVAYIIRSFLTGAFGTFGTILSIALAGGVYLLLIWLFMLRTNKLFR